MEVLSETLGPEMQEEFLLECETTEECLTEKVKDVTEEPIISEPPHFCETCMQWGGEEIGPDAGECAECSILNPEEATGDYWLAANTDRRCQTCASYGADYPDDCENCGDDLSAPNWRPMYPAFAPVKKEEVDQEDATEVKTWDSTKPAETPSAPSGWRSMRYETITVSRSLDDDGMREFADKMAAAIERKTALEAEKAAMAKDYGNRIKAAEAEAADAVTAYRDGSVTEDIYCEVLHDYDSEQVLWLDNERNSVVKSRPMLPGERQFPLITPSDLPQTAHHDGETVGKEADARARTCLDCASLGPSTTEGGEDMPEPCQTCSQSDNGETDNWTPKRHCGSCASSTVDVNMYPCRGCLLNPMSEHAGDVDRWFWEEEEPTVQETAQDVPAVAVEEVPEHDRACATYVRQTEGLGDEQESLCRDCSMPKLNNWQGNDDAMQPSEEETEVAEVIQ